MTPFVRVKYSILTGAAMFALLLHAASFAQTRSPSNELLSIATATEKIKSEYIVQVPELPLARACRDGMLKVADTRSPGQITANDLPGFDEGHVAQAGVWLHYFLEKIPEGVTASQFRDGCLQRMLGGLDPHSSYLGSSDLRQLRATAADSNKEAGGTGSVPSSVSFNILQDKYLYVRVRRLDSDAIEELGAALRSQRALGLKDMAGIVLDLRDNQGGLLTVMNGVAAAFLPPNARLGAVVGRTLDSTIQFFGQAEYYAVGSGPDPLHGLAAGVKTLPMLVLVNHKTASGAEMVAAVLQDSGRAVVAGEETAGHGTVQTIRYLNANSAIKITTAKLVRPSGAQVDLKSVRPDHIVTANMDSEADFGSSVDTALVEALRFLPGARK
jgi:hypothetical protein